MTILITSSEILKKYMMSDSVMNLFIFEDCNCINNAGYNDCVDAGYTDCNKKELRCSTFSQNIEYIYNEDINMIGVFIAQHPEIPLYIIDASLFEQ